MQPVLVVVAGPLAGERFALRAAETSIGRTAENGVAVGDPSVSRRHCVILRDERGFTIRDLGSHNGTFVNGIATREQELSPGDRIDIGDTGLVFRRYGDADPPLTPQSDTGRIGMTRFELRSPLALESAALLKLTTALVLLENIYISRGEAAYRPLERQFFELLFDLVRSDCGALALVQNGDIDVLCSWDAAANGECEPDRAAILDCLEAREPLALTRPDSVLLTIPMTLSGHCSGVLMLSSSQPGRAFVDREVQLLTAVASIISLGLNHARERAFLEA